MSNLRSADSWRSALFLRGLLSILLGCVLLSPAKAQFAQQGDKLVATEGFPATSAVAYQGWAVALSRDGNTMLVGGPKNNSRAGAVWVWTRSGSGAWSQGDTLTAPGTQFFGSAVAISSNGKTAIIGARENNSFVGAAYIFTRSGGSWSRQAGPLSAGDLSGSAQQQGYSVAISADGNTAIVGAPFDNSHAGAAIVWVRSGSSWSQQGGKLVGGNGSADAEQGYSVGLSDDGNTAIVGGPGDSTGTGAAWVWTRSERVWSQMGGPTFKLLGNLATGAAHQGAAVALSGDGNTAVVGGPYDNSSAGGVWVFALSSGSWAQQGSELVGTPVIVGTIFQGVSTALSYDGNELIEGGYGDNSNVGAAWVWERSTSGSWTQSSKLIGTNTWSGASEQGFSVAMSGDGGTAAVGGPYDSAGVTADLGAAWVYTAPDLMVSITDSGDFARGDTGDTFTVTVENAGAASTSGTVTVAVTLSSGLTATAISGHNWTTCTLASLTCTRSDALGWGGSTYDPITVTVNVSSSATSSQTCAATVSGGGELDKGNDSATDYITLPPVPDLVVSVSHIGKWYQGRVGGVYTIRVVNIGSGPTSGTVNLTDTLTGGGLSLQLATITGTWSCSVTSSLSCTNSGKLAAGAAYSALTVTVNVSSTATSPQTNHAHVSGGGELPGHPYDQNNDGYDYTTIGTGASGPDMTVVGQHFATFMRNQTAQYVIIATNSGNSPTNGTVTVTDTLPPGLTVSAVASAPGWSCTAASGSHTMTCNRSDVLPVGLSYRAIVLTVNVLSSAGSLVTNTVQVSGGGEVNTGNDQSTDATAVGG